MLNVTMADPEHNLRPRLTVVGVGGAGGNAINNMIRCGLEGCDFIAANTDSQALSLSLAHRKIQLGVNMSRGLGAGSKPDVGRSAAEEQMNDIMACLDGSDMIFITAGMGGGTGTGAAPVIARAARESGILTVGVVTKPFHFEGNNRMKMAEQGIAELQQYVDTLIVIPNQNLFRIANERTTFAEAFRMADEVLHCGVRGITDLMVMPGFMNLDFADVKTVMGEMGKAMMGTGEADGENRAILAAEAAISNPLLDDVSMKGARGVLINITGGMDMTLFEVDQAANRIREEVDPEAQIKVGSTLGDDLQGRIRVSVIATGIDAAVVQPTQQRSGGHGTNTGSGTGSSGSMGGGSMGGGAMGGGYTQHRTAQELHNRAPQQQIVTPSINPHSQFFTMPRPVTPQTVTTEATPTTLSVPAIDDLALPSIPETAAPIAHETAAIDLPSTKAVSTPSPVAAAPAQQQPPVQASRQAPPQSYSPKPAVQATQQRPVMPPAGIMQSQPRTTSGTASDIRMTQLSTPSNTSDQRRNRRSESLFTRITGFGMVRPSSQKADDDYADENEIRASSTKPSATPDKASPASRSDDHPDLATEQTPAELLDIPAFLRRQTNH